MTEQEFQDKIKHWLTREEIVECVKYLKEQGNTCYSISRLDNYSNCKMNYFLTYIMGNYGGGSCYSEIGSCIHQHLEDIYSEKETVEQMQEHLPDQL